MVLYLCIRWYRNTDVGNLPNEKKPSDTKEMPLLLSFSSIILDFLLFLSNSRCDLQCQQQRVNGRCVHYIQRANTNEEEKEIDSIWSRSLKCEVILCAYIRSFIYIGFCVVEPRRNLEISIASFVPFDFVLYSEPFV